MTDAFLSAGAACTRTSSAVKWHRRISPGHPPTEEPLRCIECDTQLPASFFSIHRKSRAGRRSHCLACQSDRCLRQLAVNVTVASKECNGTICEGRPQPVDSFSRQKGTSDGLSSYCRNCSAHINRLRCKRLKTVPYGSLGTTGAFGPLRCPCCDEFKPTSEFYSQPGSRRGKLCLCKQCHSQKGKDRRRAAQKTMQEKQPGSQAVPLSEDLS